MNLRILAGAALVVCSPAFAQVAPQSTAPIVPIAAPSTDSAMLRTGTEVPLKLSEMLTTKGKKLKVGQRVHLEVAEPVLLNGVIVIPSGSPAMGEITDVRNKGMWGKSGHFGGRVLYTTVNGRQLRLSGGFDDKGTAGGIGATAVSAIVFLPAGFFMTGTSAKLDIGTPVKAYMDEDVALAMPAAGPTPLVVGTPVQTVAATQPTAGSATMTPAVLQTVAPVKK